MLKIEILIVGIDADLIDDLSAFINENPAWNTTGVVDEEQAIEKFYQQRFDIILLAGTLPQSTEKKLHKIFTVHDKDIPFIHYRGGERSIIKEELNSILTANDSRTQASYSFNDDVFAKR